MQQISSHLFWQISSVRWTSRPILLNPYREHDPKYHQVSHLSLPADEKNTYFSWQTVQKQSDFFTERATRTFLWTSIVHSSKKKILQSPVVLSLPTTPALFFFFLFFLKNQLIELLRNPMPIKTNLSCSQYDGSNLRSVTPFSKKRQS